MDQYSLSVRRLAAQKRIRVAVTKLAGEEASAKLEVGHKDSRVDEVLRLEAIADVLEQLPSAPPATPAANHSRIFSKADGLYIVDDAGAVTRPFASAAGGGYTQNVRVHMSTDQNVSKRYQSRSKSPTL